LKRPGERTPPRERDELRDGEEAGRVWLVLERNHQGPPTVFAICCTRERAVSFAEEWIEDMRRWPDDDGWYVEPAELDVLVPLN
jgi:hypothetical protein